MPPAPLALALLLARTAAPPPADRVELHEVVTVTAPPPVERAALDQLVDERTIVALPLNGRSFIGLTTLAPGVAMPPDSPFPRINGGRPRTNEYLVDGLSVLQPEPGQVALFPVVDAIEDLTVVTNSPPAEFGRFNGGVVALRLKSGGAVLTGNAFEFLRHEALNARNFFASTNREKPAFRRHQFGGTLGGPLQRGRTFFFADYQGQRQVIGRTMISTVPTRLQRQGVFTEPIGGRVPLIYDPATTAAAASGGSTRTAFPANTIPRARMDPVALALLDRYPLPSSEGTANNYRRTGNETDSQRQFDLRLDWRLGANGDRAFARLSHAHDDFVPVTPLPDGSGVATGTPGPQRTGAWAFASSYQRAVSKGWLNELRAGDTRRAVVRDAAPLPAYSISGYQPLGSPPGTAADFDTGVTEIFDAVTRAGARHTIKFGLDFRWERLNIVQPPSPLGAFTFTSLFTDLPGTPDTGAPLASFLLGQVQTFSIDLQRRQIRNRAHVQEYFVQDDWRASDRLTVNAGLRYTLNFPSTEEHDQAAVFNLQTREIEFLGRDGHPRSARKLHTLNLGPRLGLVARVTDRTTVRSGYALVWIEQAGITTPFTTPAFPFLQTVSERTLDNVAPAFTLAEGPSVAPVPLTSSAGLGQGVFAVDRGLGSGYVQQWNVSLTRHLTAKTSVEVAYVGSKIVHVGVPDTNLNQLSVDQLARGRALLERVPNPYVGIIPRASSLGDPTIPLAQLLKPYPEYTTVSLYRNNVGTTSYRGIEARLERRWSRGLSASISYTRSRLVDDASSVFDAAVLTGPVANFPVADSFDRARERDVSTGDIPDVLVATAAWTVRGWTFAPIVRLQSGVPVAVTQATNFNAFAGFGTQRPNVAGAPALPPGERTANRWFNTAAFTEAPPFTLGSASRNPVRGPSYRDMDLAVSRRVGLRSRSAIELRLEIFNLLNTPPLGNPNGTLGTPAFGTITTAGDPRVAQLAVKLSF